jgi:hypothetical protein
LRLKTGKISDTIPKNGSAMMYTSGCPKNQKRCCHSRTPPLAGSYTCEPKIRSLAAANIAAARTGKAIRMRRLVMSVFQEKIGRRHIVMPGARIVMIVVMKFTAPKMVPKPLMPSPTIQRFPPTPGEKEALASGWYANQPNEAAPCGVRKPATAMRDPKRKSHSAKAFRRGNATSGAPICRGRIAFAKPAKSGVANISSITVPCIVKSWLYCSFVGMICIPGAKSSARMSSAITPPMRKNSTDEIRYMYPIVLWSVEVIHRTITLPFCSVRDPLRRAAWRGGSGAEPAVPAMLSFLPRSQRPSRHHRCREGSGDGCIPH